MYLLIHQSSPEKKKQKNKTKKQKKICEREPNICILNPLFSWHKLIEKSIFKK